MKRIIVFLMVLFCITTIARADDPTGINLTVGIIDQEEIGNNLPRGPIEIPSASIDGHTLYINAHPDYVLQLVDPSDDSIIYYEMDLPAGTNQTVLPSTLSGTYEIRLIWGNWYFYGIINL